jgi:hypothetical protein
MHSMHFIDEWHLLVVTYTEPFSGSDIIEVARELAIPGSRAGEHLCVLVDLTGVSVSKLSASDSQRSVATRKTRISGHTAEPLAFMLKDLSDYGSVRMHNQWAEALGLREEKDTHITTSLREALDWLETRTAQPGLADSVSIAASWRTPTR